MIQGGMRWGEYRREWPVLVGYLLYTLANTYPYSDPRLIGRVLPQPGDALWEIWQFKWFAHQLFRDPRHLWDVPAFHPVPRAMTFNDSLLGLALFAAPIGGLTGNWVLARNVLLLAGLFLSAWWTYRLARAFGIGSGGAFLAGLLYAFCTMRMSHHVANLKMAFGAFIPWVFYCLTRYAQRGQPRYLLGAFLGWGLQMISSMYYGFFLLTLLPLYLLGMWVAYRTERAAEPPSSPVEFIGTVAGIGIGAALLALGFFVPYWETSYLYGLRRGLEEAIWGAHLRSYVSSGAIPALLLRPWLHLPTDRVLAWPGLGVLLALAAPPWRDRVRAVLWGCALLSFLLSLGPQTPVFTAAFRLLPYFQTMRYPDRWAILVVFFLALLAGWGLSDLQSRMSARWGRILTGLVLAVTGVDLWHAPLSARPVPDVPPVYRRLAAHRDPGAVAVFPLFANYWEGSKFYGYWATSHWKPVLGAVAAWAPPSAEWVRTALAEFPSPHAFWLAAALDIRYLVFHPQSFRNVGREAEWEWYRRALTTLPPRWVLRYEQEREDILITLNLEQIRRDMPIVPPRRFRWESPRADQIRFPVDPEARRALTDGDPSTVWVVPYTEEWHLRLDLGAERSVRAVRILGDPKPKDFTVWSSTDGQAWRSVPVIPWWLWVGVRHLPEAREYPDPQAWAGRAVLLCAPNRTRYLKITTTPVAGRIAVQDLFLVLEP
jgi:hypothetical protein